MGHRDSSAQFGGDGTVFCADGRVAEDIAQDAAGGEGGRASEDLKSGASASRETQRVLRRAAAGAKWILLFVVRCYITFLSPFFGGACKFYPSCSNYAQEAIARHGARRGVWLAMMRLGRCRPFTQAGYDPVPDEIGAGDIHDSFPANDAPGIAAADRAGNSYFAKNVERESLTRGVRNSGETSRHG